MRRALVVVTLLALGSAALAQDGLGGETGRPPTEEQLRLCPELKGAIGLRKDQLLALFFELDDRKVDARKVRSLFDAERDAALLDGYLDEKGRYRAQTGLRAVVAGLGSAGLAWALDRFEHGKPEARGRALDALTALDAREAWQVLESRLGDTRSVPDWRSSQEAPPGYKHLRVCDHAAKVLGQKLIDVTNPPETRVGPLIAIDERDARVKALADFLAKDAAYKAHVAKARSLEEQLDEPSRKLLHELIGR